MPEETQSFDVYDVAENGSLPITLSVRVGTIGIAVTTVALYDNAPETPDINYPNSGDNHGNISPQVLGVESYVRRYGLMVETTIIFGHIPSTVFELDELITQLGIKYCLSGSSVKPGITTFKPDKERIYVNKDKKEVTVTKIILFR